MWKSVEVFGLRPKGAFSKYAERIPSSFPVSANQRVGTSPTRRNDKTWTRITRYRQTGLDSRARTPTTRAHKYIHTRQTWQHSGPMRDSCPLVEIIRETPSAPTWRSASCVINDTAEPRRFFTGDFGPAVAARLFSLFIYFIFFFFFFSPADRRKKSALPVTRDPPTRTVDRIAPGNFANSTSVWKALGENDAVRVLNGTLTNVVPIARLRVQLLRTVWMARVSLAK